MMNELRLLIEKWRERADHLIDDWGISTDLSDAADELEEVLNVQSESLLEDL